MIPHWQRVLVVAAFALSFVVCAEQASNGTTEPKPKRTIEVGRKLPVYVNKINPFDNPSETYT
jgi:hypothetical protein